MRKIYEYSHLGGLEILTVRYNEIEQEIDDKFQYFFNEGHCDVGVEIVPSYALHREMSSGVSYGEQLIDDIERLKRHFPSVPIKVILIDI